MDFLSVSFSGRHFLGISLAVARPPEPGTVTVLTWALSSHVTGPPESGRAHLAPCVGPAVLQLWAVIFVIIIMVNMITPK